MMRKILIALAALVLAPFAALADIGQFQDKTFYTASSTGTGAQVVYTWTPLQLVGVSSIYMQFTSVGSGATPFAECSNDGGTTWLSCETSYGNAGGGAINVGANTAQLPASTSSIFSIRVQGNSVRLRLGALTSGTFTFIATANTSPTIPSTVVVANGAAGPLWVMQPNTGTFSGYITASATGTTAITTATLAANASKTTYICGFTIASNATAATSGNATITGTITGTLNYTQGVGLSPAVSITQQTFTPCIPGSASNTAIAVNSIAAGTGGVTSVTAWGFQQQ